VGFSRAFLGEKAPGHVLAAIGLALTGAALIAAGDWSAAPSSLLGSLLAVAGAIALALYHVAGRGLRETMPLGAYVFTVWTVAALTLAVLCALGRVPFVGYDARAISCFLALALLPTLAGHGLVNRSLRSLSAPTVGLFLLGEPLGASLLGYVFSARCPAVRRSWAASWSLAALVLVVARRE
jgi:drug/metabolite transporter (DMT)-like permease